MRFLTTTIDSPMVKIVLIPCLSKWKFDMYALKCWKIFIDNGVGSRDKSNVDFPAVDAQARFGTIDFRRSRNKSVGIGDFLLQFERLGNSDVVFILLSSKNSTPFDFVDMHRRWCIR